MPTDDLEQREDQSMTELIVIRGLTIQLGQGADAFIVDIPELTIDRGSFTSILGPSGCGKTSLLMVLGLLRGSRADPEFSLTCEELSFHLSEPLPGQDERILRVYDSAKKVSGCLLPEDQVEDLRQRLIGFCLQSGELIPSLGLAENVSVPANLCRFPDPYERARGRLSALEMADHRGRLPSELSGGQNQRGVLARSLVHDPPLVILDEPTSSLDRRTAETAIKLLKERARRRGQTIVMVTHDSTLATDLSDRIIEMDEIDDRRGGVVRVISAQNAGPEAPAAASSTAQTPAVSAAGRGTLGYYFQLSLLDAFGPLATYFGGLSRGVDSKSSRLRRISTYVFALQLVKNSLIAVALGLLILLLQGIRSGLIEEFRQTLLRSPTAREVVITPMMTSGSLTAESLRELSRQHPEIERIIPHSTDLAALEDPSGGEEINLTLVGTLPEDPKLAVIYHEQDFSGLDADSLAVSARLASELDLAVGSEISIRVARDLDVDGRRRETSAAQLRVSHILDQSEKKKAYTHLDLLTQIADYKAGRPVPGRGWKGFAQSAAPRYASYLLFAKRPVSAREERILKSRGLVAEALDGADPRRTLYGRLRDDDTLREMGKEPIHVYAVLSGRQEGDLRWLDAGIAEYTEFLVDCDGILLPWNDPLPAKLEGSELTLVGLSASSRWLKGYLHHRRGLFPRGESGWHLAFGDRREETEKGSLEVTLDEDGQNPVLEVQIHPPSPDQERAGIAVIPAPLLAQLHLARAGLAVPDHDQRIFRRAREERAYYQARIFVRDVFEVADLHEQLAGVYGIRSNQARVREVQRYSEVLDLLVRILSSMALLIAFFTVYVVFHEISSGKKRMIGTLRIMGLSQGGVLVLLMMRGLLVALVACGLIFVLGQLLSATLNYAYREGLCLLEAVDYLRVTSWIIAICLLAVLRPAWKVSRIDPVVALEEAKLSS